MVLVNMQRDSVMFHNLSDMSVPLNAVQEAIGKESVCLLEAEKNRLIFVLFMQNTFHVYQGENTKKLFEFNVDDIKNLTSSQFNIRLTNHNQDIMPLIVVLGAMPAFQLTVSAQSHGELLLIDGMSQSLDAKADHITHHIVLEDSAVLANARLFLQSAEAPIHTERLSRFVDIQANAIFYDKQMFVVNQPVTVNSNIKLLGKSAQSYSAGCLFSSAGQFYYEPVQEHFEQHTKSLLNFNVVLTKRAKSFFRGLIVMHQDAQYSEAYQENKNLLLSRSARADSEPRLEIIPNDVSCKHGSATAEIDKKQLYYLISRGFNPTDAKNMIVKSFANAAFTVENGSQNNFLQSIVLLANDHIFNTRAETHFI